MEYWRDGFNRDWSDGVLDLKQLRISDFGFRVEISNMLNV